MPEPDLAAPVAAAIADYPDAHRDTLLALRALVYEVAQRTEGVGPVEETVRWGQPAYVTRTGTTIRLAAARGDDDAVGVYTSCQTPLVADFATEHGDRFAYDGVRGIHVAAGEPLRTRELADFLESALTYKLRKRA
ncbi:DUF1801 domain-containing protein [Demequina sp.]|uniref:DUF1801 domain-containing protein n=1 Tax=Demequina sp. TaxID=2050685 RepID=UPI0025C50DB1|nr:DUF1801 domain-containing protein [Demequina sp.]